MVYYYCSDENNLNDMNFLRDEVSFIQNIQAKVVSAFDIELFPRENHNLSQSDILIIDLNACSNSEETLKDNINTLKAYNGVTTFIYCPGEIENETAAMIQRLNSLEGITVLDEMNYKRKIKDYLKGELANTSRTNILTPEQSNYESLDEKTQVQDKAYLEARQIIDQLKKELIGE